jgi:N-methylhydantoinase A/oxoprolinase/acetone carboxylase beta subunit
LDVGGTSTDVSRFAGGRYEVVYETTTAGVTIQSPQLDINTVAAGGGSCLTFRQGLFRAGPESAGAEPGPACYRYVDAGPTFQKCTQTCVMDLNQERRSISRDRCESLPWSPNSRVFP